SLNGSSATFPVTTNANLSSVGGSCGTASGDVATVSVSITGAGSQSGTASCTSGAWTFNLSPNLSAEGGYSATASQLDAAGNSGGGGAKSVTPDKTAPVVSVATVNGSIVAFPYSTRTNTTSVGGSCGTLSGDSGSVSVTITGNGLQSGTATCSSGTWTLTLATPISAEGTSTVTAAQPDAAGNNGSSGAKSIVTE